MRGNKAKVSAFQLILAWTSISLSFPSWLVQLLLLEILKVFLLECDQTVTFSEVVLEVMRHLEGAYALIFKILHYPNELIACKCRSPLLLGVKLLAYHLTVLRGYNVDQPRNLAKSVTTQ
ncbi:hypothetical protein F0562_014469 [Nyssa sinensis]|uniref:Uncharacterized protein n=1 Tax=Nyssa sinensis TaxID=561372 RepID=A0A5J4ZMW4_9ASTE|nr:hypothetical protein F0562_014469 [Nyssa sinensis]